MYQFPAALLNFVDDDVLHSNKGTTHAEGFFGNAFYALATLPLIHKFPKSVIQAWYADDASAREVLYDLCLWRI